MWDYGCWPLWEPGSADYALEPDSLPLSSATKERLAKWAAIPDAKYERHKDCPQDMVWTEEERRSFEAEGRSIWKIVRHELGENFRVVYHNVLAGPVRGPEDEF